MKTMHAKIALITSLFLLLALSFGAAYAQAEEPLPACAGETVTGTVVAVDETSGLITIELEDDTLCTVQYSDGFEHPITSLLGAYFDGLSLDQLEDHVENLKVEVICDETEGCDLADGEGDPMMVRITGITDNGDGTWTVEFTYLDENGDPQTDTFTTEDGDLADGWADSLMAVNDEFALTMEGILEGSGEEIEALHDSGLGFGVIVKIFAMASEAQQACDAADSEPDPAGPTSEEAVDFCTVSVSGLVEEFQNGTGLGQLFKKYGKPAILGVGHVRNGGANGNGTPPDNACGYWRNHGDGYLPEGCQDKPGGKPPWAGTPGGPNGNGGDGDD